MSPGPSSTSSPGPRGFRVFVFRRRGWARALPDFAGYRLVWSAAAKEECWSHVSGVAPAPRPALQFGSTAQVDRLSAQRLEF